VVRQDEIVAPAKGPGLDVLHNQDPDETAVLLTGHNIHEKRMLRPHESFAQSGTANDRRKSSLPKSNGACSMIMRGLGSPGLLS
jgi:hypothetical protein